MLYSPPAVFPHQRGPIRLRWGVMSTSIYIGHIDIDGTVEAKIRRKHDVTGHEVIEALQWPARARAAWEDHPLHGRRVIASGTTSTGRVILAALQPVDEADGTWRLKSARANR